MDTDGFMVWGAIFRAEEDFAVGSNFGFWIYLAEEGGFKAD